MMGSYQNANNLLEALIIYSLCIEGGNYNPNSKEKAEMVKIVLDDLINRLKSGSSLQDFDFKNFRHDISSLYHPDAFHNFPEEMKIDPDLLFGSMYSELKDVETATKAGIPVRVTDEDLDDSFDFNYKTTPNDSKARWFYSSERKNTSYETHTDEKRKQDEESWRTPFPNHNVQQYYTIGDIIKENFNYLFLGKPSSTEQYFALKTRYEKKQEKLKNRLQMIITTLTLLSMKFSRCREEYLDATTIQSIEKEYYRQYNEARDNIESIKNIVNENKATLSSIRAKHSPEVIREKYIWDREKLQLQIMYNDVKIRHQIALGNGNIPIELQNEFNSISQRLAQYSMTDKEAYLEIERDILGGDRNYVENYRIYKSNIQRLEQWNNKLEYLLKHSDDVKDEIYEERNKRYEQRKQEINNEISRTNKTKEKIERKLEKTNLKRETLVSEFGRYENERRR